MGKNGGQVCPPEGEEKADCTISGCTTTTTPTTPAPIDCEMSPWSDWSICEHPIDATCDGSKLVPSGTQRSGRVVKVYSDYGGTACTENLEQERECDTPCTTTTATTTATSTPTTTGTTTTTPEPIDCEEHWGPWSACQRFHHSRCLQTGLTTGGGGA